MCLKSSDILSTADVTHNTLTLNLNVMGQLCALSLPWQPCYNLFRIMLKPLNPPVKIPNHKSISDLLKIYGPFGSLLLNSGNIFLQQLLTFK